MVTLRSCVGLLNQSSDVFFLKKERKTITLTEKANRLMVYMQIYSFHVYLSEFTFSCLGLFGVRLVKCVLKGFRNRISMRSNCISNL